MNTPPPYPNPNPNPVAEAFLCAAVDGLQTLAMRQRGLLRAPNHRAILRHGMEQSAPLCVKPAPMPVGEKDEG